MLEVKPSTFFFSLLLVPEIFYNLHCFVVVIIYLFFFTILFVLPNGVVDKNAIVPDFSLMNQASLDKILKAEVFVHTNGQLRAAHLILDYMSVSNAFQAPKCIIKARDPRLQRISVATPRFLIISSVP